MNGERLRSEVESRAGTQLDRLDSETLLVALTDGALTRERVLSVAADSEYAAAETFRVWAEKAETEPACEAFEAVSGQEQDHYERVVAALPDHDPPDAGGPMHAYLRGLDGAIERVGAGLLGRPLVSIRSHTQVISFFRNGADPDLADLFRDLRRETNAELERGLAVLDALCETRDDWDRARATAAYTVQVAYDDYADTIERVDPDSRPIR
jgi:hypothetical protein